jgi:YggT family protein
VAIICLVLQLFAFAVLARIVMSWIRITPGSPFASVFSVVFNITEPVLGPIRRLIPPVRMGVTAIDVSPIIVFVGITLICR